MIRAHIPLALTALRALLAPVMVWLALWWPSPMAFGLCLLAAFFSDIFDGVLARRWGVSTPLLRRLDSLADTLFYLAACFAVWHLQPSALTDRWPALLVLAALELLRYGFDLIKFHREASYHMWSSKLWGVALFAGFMSLLAWGKDSAWVDAAVYIGIVADIEGLAISMTLSSWRSDVPSIVHACRLQGRAQA